MPRTDRVISGCLDRIRRGHLDAVLVLLDYLQDTADLREPQLRALVEVWQANVARHAASRKTRRPRYSRWEEIAFHHYSLQCRVGRLFRCPWAPAHDRVYFVDMPKVLGGLWKKNPVKLEDADQAEGV